MADRYPEWSERVIDLAVALAPVAGIKNMVSPVQYLIPFSNQIEVSLYTI